MNRSPELPPEGEPACGMGPAAVALITGFAVVSGTVVCLAWAFGRLP